MGGALPNFTTSEVAVTKGEGRSTEMRRLCYMGLQTEAEPLSILVSSWCNCYMSCRMRRGGWASKSTPQGGCMAVNESGRSVRSKECGWNREGDSKLQTCKCELG